MAYGVILGQTPKVPQPQSDFPVGGIIIWSGSESNIPNNWHLCDGTNGTPDLRNQFVIGAGDTYSVGNTGGESEHTLTINEMPSHSHTLTIGVTPGSTGINYPTQTKYDINDSNFFAIESTGGSRPHNNLPPYYALCYIMKIA